MSLGSINVGQDFSFAASTDLSTKQYYFVVLNSSDELAVAGADVSCIGVLQDTPDAEGKSAAVRCFGVSYVTLGGTVTVNDKIASNASGKGVTATAAHVTAGTPEPLAGSYVMGIAMKSGSSGDIIPVLLTHAGITN